MQFLVPRAKRKSLLRKYFDTLRLNAQHKLTARRYASLIGTLNAVRGAVTSAPLHIWPLLHLQKTVLAKLQSWDQQVHLTPRVIQELEWWQTELKDWNGKSVIPQKHQHILTIDTSHLGWERWDPGCIVQYWADQPDNDDLSDFELAHKSFTLFATPAGPDVRMQLV